MKYAVKPCSSQEQDGFSAFYLDLARPVVQSYGVSGKAVVREAVRKYAASLGFMRREQLLGTGNRINLETIFSDGFGLPCGERTRKEWIESGEQQLFVNITACPHASYWMDQDARELGHMFCEEYYPALVHAAASPRAQINLGSTLMNGRDEFCRLSIYLRPANLPPEARAISFAAFDPSNAQPTADPSCTVDFAQLRALLLQAFLQSAGERLGADCQQTVREAAQSFDAEARS